MSSEETTGTSKQFDATAFAPGWPGCGVTGKLQVTAGGLRFESPHGNLELPVAGLLIAPGGANDALLFFSHPTQPQTTIHTADHSVLSDPALATHPELAQQGRRARGKARRASLGLAIVAGVLLAGILALVLSKNWLVRLAADSVPVDWEVKAGDTLFEQFVGTKRLITDEAIGAQLKKITDPLVSGIADDRYALKFHIMEDESLNAFALPGGNVVLYTGLLLAADSPEEVAGVLAHEIAHVTRRHSIRNIVSTAGLYLVVQTLVGDASGVVAVLTEKSTLLLDRKFSRDFEREADEIGWDYLIRSDIDPSGMIRFFERVRAEDRKAGGGEVGALAVVSTHPATQERIVAVQAKWRTLAKKSGYRRFDLDYAAFKTKLRSSLKTEN
jgi:predicted Zn-dependent protease